MDGIDKKTLKKIEKIISPYYFGVTKWTIISLAGILGNMFRFKKRSKLSREEKQNIIRDYFSLSSKDRRGFKDTQIIENIFKGYVEEVLRKEGFCSKSFNWPIFPPLCFKLVDPPAIVIVSPRDKLECSRSFLLKSDLSAESIEGMENQIDNLGVSSWIGRVGGLSLFPFMVSKHGDCQWTLTAIIHEWVHHFLFSRTRIGFFYLLEFLIPNRISRQLKINPREVRLINEGLADFISQELAEKIFLNFPELWGNQIKEKKGNGFFQDLIAVRQKVEEYLSSREVDEAENYMKEMAGIFLEKSKYFKESVRKLNQASLSFLGNYEEANPLMPKFKKIRDKCSSLKEFLKRIKKVKSVKDLEKIN